MTNGLFSMGVKDWIKALIIFISSTVISIGGDAIVQAVASGEYTLAAIHWKEIGGAVLVAVITYIQKQFFTNSNDQYLKKEQ
ncbi:hypothetical protein UFOVP916_33 [uncultured Caudovirales phage]|uniref:Holin n=1 Tax=uncultured Caudovirales phage TaxID=2100421 RepID=A0A6J5SGS4_9CAUD|nr:hypothetical protein UFOVP827_54 [uncultured Caudovirales phage]CAB4171462.1 hypothetical protein UFOVP916_33 [uncultured Caudovirales phage]CAB4177459.1 hypothetical protein UFOVP1001_57 [uncultured Caudovirales phage]CAB4199110.1 hypothetical protein UFOVP1338_19 [uncultured Caudovirales phage]CAB4213355.1 hypothetical protein UFOVP1447_14 [uncultured Caudovirales phage]